jgi:hypothetical protein
VITPARKPCPKTLIDLLLRMTAMRILGSAEAGLAEITTPQSKII